MPLKRGSVGPDVIPPFRFAPDAGPIPVQQPALLRLARGHLQPLAPPDPRDPPVMDEPARRHQQRAGLPVAVAAVPASQFHKIVCQRGLILSSPRPLAASSDAGRAPGRRVGARGWSVSPGGHLQDQLVEGEIRDRLARPLVLNLQVLHPPIAAGRPRPQACVASLPSVRPRPGSKAIPQGGPLH